LHGSFSVVLGDETFLLYMVIRTSLSYEPIIGVFN